MGLPYALPRPRVPEGARGREIPGSVSGFRQWNWVRDSRFIQSFREAPSETGWIWMDDQPGRGDWNWAVTDPGDGAALVGGQAPSRAVAAAMVVRALVRGLTEQAPRELAA